MVFICKKNKKANLFVEILTIIIVLFVVGITFIVAYESLGELVSDIKADYDNDSKEYEVLDDYENDSPALLDGIVIFIFVGLWIIALVFAYFIDTHPVFFIVSLIFLIFICILTAILGNASIEIIDNFSTSNFPMTYWLFEHLLIVILIVATTILIALFAKTKH